MSSTCGAQGAIDNRPLWEFIPTGLGSSVPATCHRETFDALLAATPVALQKAVMHTALTTCIADYVAAGSTAPVFTANTGGIVDHGLALFDIQSSPRFNYTPQMHEPVPVNGRHTYRIKAFRAVFIQRTGANNSSSFFEPGPWNGPRSPTTRRPTRPRSCSRRHAPAAHRRRPTRAERCSPGHWARSATDAIVIGANAVIELVG